MQSWYCDHSALTKVHSHWPAECKADCASCFSETFCTRCHPGHFLFRGKCENVCPKGLEANTALRECTGNILLSSIHPLHLACVYLCNEVEQWRTLRPSVSECPAGCELCARKNTCTRCRADMHHLHGQCHHTCPRGFESDMQLKQCIPQGEKCSLSPCHFFFF